VCPGTSWYACGGLARSSLLLLGRRGKGDMCSSAAVPNSGRGSRELFRAIWWMNMCFFLLLDSQQQYQTTWYFNYFTSDRGWHITLKTDAVFTKHPYDSNPFYFWLEGKTEDWPSSSRSLLHVPWQAQHGRKKPFMNYPSLRDSYSPQTTFQDRYSKPLQKTQIQDPRVGSR
jgi:hypothetical protein